MEFLVSAFLVGLLLAMGLVSALHFVKAYRSYRNSRKGNAACLAVIGLLSMSLVLLLSFAAAPVPLASAYAEQTAHVESGYLSYVGSISYNFVTNDNTAALKVRCDRPDSLTASYPPRVSEFFEVRDNLLKSKYIAWKPTDSPATLQQEKDSYTVTFTLASKQ